MPTSSRTSLRPVLVGEQNPYGGDPYFALYPAPDGCSGHRLCTLVLGMHCADYLAEFERVNLCAGPWSPRLSREVVGRLLGRAGHYRFVLLGAKVCGAFSVPFRPFESARVSSRHQALVLPHPSGLCRLWNEAGAFGRARACVAALAPDVAHLLGVANSC